MNRKAMRYFSIKRESAFTNMLRKWEIYMDGLPAELIGNGETVQIKADNKKHSIQVKMPVFGMKKISTPEILIPEGEKNYKFRVYIKNSILNYSIRIDRIMD